TADGRRKSRKKCEFRVRVPFQQLRIHGHVAEQRSHASRTAELGPAMVTHRQWERQDHIPTKLLDGRVAVQRPGEQEDPRQEYVIPAECVLVPSPHPLAFSHHLGDPLCGRAATDASTARRQFAGLQHSTYYEYGVGVVRRESLTP